MFIMKSLKVGIIGCGNIGGAVLKGLLDRGVASAGSIVLNDKDRDRATALAMQYGCRQEELASLMKSSEHLIIAVKPQDSENLLKEMSGYVTSQTIVSVMAGVKISTITELLGKDLPIARAMPNMAAVIGESVTAVSFSDKVERKEEVKKIFSAIGRVVEVDEASLDAVTALSGSGPAYLFYLVDAMISAGEKTGLKADVAKELAVQTVFGAAALLRKEGSSPGDLIKAVASKGGTTEAALSIFEKKGLKEIIEAAVSRARERSKELSGG